ncbi:hypothetical protein R1flu_002494 [Riccia fluitans]|uniref:Uncharacterized protein n=1 Tax=Riccia fluitans TaxID=41844 RepID=A0ABD1Y6B0_9MARC
MIEGFYYHGAKGEAVGHSAFHRRMSPFLVPLIVALGIVGLVGFQRLKERKATSALHVHGQLRFSYSFVTACGSTHGLEIMSVKNVKQPSTSREKFYM